ncbi:hypothetical protein [Pseudonocardia endophytica]|uniref:Uncharacterized protein n=1 Tax=Pseudonocardia endophytica TaxID=401976 RepID=A0A4R1HIU5_PSEEN|nr:hypothetical protein [Pseudonocardia endophytica]TCK20230.1 hypothetical protein EV378_4181 [Pseudonocardia endophytica]
MTGSSRTIVVDPPGELREVDTRHALERIGLLNGGGRRARAALDDVLAAPHRVMPPVLYAASEVLTALDRPAEAAVWFYAGQLRARYDATRCTDPSAASALGLLRDRYGEPVNRWAFADEGRVRRAAVTAVAWDRSAPHDYDHRWIALHGMRAFLPDDGGPASVPQQEWPALAAQVRAEYLTGLREVLREVFGPRP